MKIVKMSLAAAVLVGASAFAIDNVKVSGNAQLFYSTQDAKVGYVGLTGNSASLFDKDSSAADAGLNLNISADLAKNSLVTVSAGAGYTVLSTLGLENNLVGNVWGGAHTATAPTGASYGSALGGAKVDNANWMNEAWIALSLNQGSKSTLKLGRMELDTPLAFTEKWSIEKNTFEAGVLINQDIPDTTLVAAYVGNGNGTETFGQDARSNVNTLGLAVGAVVNQNGNFTTYGKDGAYAYGIINNSWKPLTAQAWYYDVSKVAQAFWLQGDLDTTTLGLAGVTAGIQYANVDATDAASGSGVSKTTAGKLGYSVKDMFAASVAYSAVSDQGIVGAANTATSTGASKLYTEAWWNYGQVTAIGASAWNVTLTSPVAGLFDAGFYLTSVDQKRDGQDMTEVAVTAGKKFGPLDATLAYVSSSFNHKSTGNLVDSNMVQAYLTLNF
ncbi:MAG: hypothetical protein PHX13_05990 [Thiovulaceae bacterium]|nr:hypothetical protein [Sulfurimonadaceae bacterium]